MQKIFYKQQIYSRNINFFGFRTCFHFKVDFAPCTSVPFAQRIFVSLSFIRATIYELNMPSVLIKESRRNRSKATSKILAIVSAFVSRLLSRTLHPRKSCSYETRHITAIVRQSIEIRRYRLSTGVYSLGGTEFSEERRIEASES